LNYGVKESSDKISMESVEKLTLEHIGIAFGILILGSTEPKVHLGVIYSLPIATYVLKTTIATQLNSKQQETMDAGVYTSMWT